jgi:hypothetical protein
MSSRKTKTDVVDLSKLHTCDFCHKSFSRESTLVSHTCEAKRRWNQRNDSNVKKGFWAFQRLYQSFGPRNNGIPRPYIEFQKSAFYNALVKYGSWCEENSIIEWEMFTKWLIKESVKVDKWCDWNIYQQWLTEFLFDEDHEQALARSLQTVNEWAKNSEQDWKQFFQLASVNTILNWIISGKISGWLLYNCNSAVGFLERCNPEQLEMVQNRFPPTKWKIKFMRQKDITDIVRTILKDSGF